jgi:alpha-L-rhamnosidase
MREQAGESGLWTTGGHFGDWLAFASTASDYPGATPIRILLQQPISPIHKTAF